MFARLCVNLCVYMCVCYRACMLVCNYVYFVIYLAFMYMCIFVECDSCLGESVKYMHTR